MNNQNKNDPTHKIAAAGLVALAVAVGTTLVVLPKYLAKIEEVSREQTLTGGAGTKPSMQINVVIPR